MRVLSIVQRLKGEFEVLETGTMRCPMCREMAMLPVGGANGFPSSFLINQLLDLMQKQRRDVVPNCAVHQQEQLLYCEACDLVFCLHCDAPSTRSCSEHTVVPFSIAIKRMSEIVVFKVKQCVASLNTAAANVECETVQLDRNVDKIVDELNASFQEVSQLVENRRRELLESVRLMRDQKRKVLRDQMEVIDAHRKRQHILFFFFALLTFLFSLMLERELENCQLDVRQMGARTKRVMAATEEALALTEPRENAFLKLHTQPKKLLQGYSPLLPQLGVPRSAKRSHLGTLAGEVMVDEMEEMEKSLGQFGAISGSTTFPTQCTVELQDSASVYTETRLLLTTFDVDGKRRNSGGDPVKAEIRRGKVSAEQICDPAVESINAVIKDNENGTYSILFRVREPGEYSARVTIFGRAVKSNPFLVSVSAHHSPKWQFGSLGSNISQLNQPVKICQDPKGYMYILDTGNNRIKMLDGNGEYMDDITSAALKGASTVGMAILPSGDFLTLNWRTKEVTKCNHAGEPLQTMSFSEFVEPIDICVDSRGRLLIADTACAKVFVFDAAFRPLFSFDVSAHCDSAPITCVCLGLNDEILVGTCSSLLLFDGGGRFIREIPLTASPQRSRTMAAACAVCPMTGSVIAAVVDSKKNRAHLAVCQYKGSFVFSMDSHGSRLRRPCGLCIGTHKWVGMCFVVDSATHSVKAYQFK
uniref:B box-type domain-containing protein n=1 Tax=Ascaris lumbricoides TaxID=6252 RepID=A0A9J2QAW5_ASCLU